MAGASPRSKVLRVAVIVDEAVCDELHQTAPGRVTVGASTRSTLTLHDPLDRRRSSRQWAPVWLLLGLGLTAGGAAWFGKEVVRERTLTQAAQVDDPYAEPPPHEDKGAIGFLLFLTLRFGLLAAAIFSGLSQMLSQAALTYRFDEWYGQSSLVATAIVAIIVLYGLRVSLAGRPLLGSLERVRS